MTSKKTAAQKSVSRMANNAYLSHPQVSRRGLKALESLENSGAVLIEVKVTAYSSVRSLRLLGITLPPNTAPLCVLREGLKLTDLARIFLDEGDRVVLLTEHASHVRELFTGWQWEECVSGTALACS